MTAESGVDLIFAHPKPRAQALQERGAAVLAGLMALAGIAAILFGLGDGRLFLMLGVGVALLLLTLPVIMLTAASPAIEITDEVLILLPSVWRRRAVLWADIRAIKDHPLLPVQDGETLRRAMVGRRKYQMARGVLIVIPSLPLQYRVLGLFAGEGFTGAIAVTSRTHVDYDAAISEIEGRAEAAVQSTAPEL